MTLVRDVVAEARREFMTSQRDRYNVVSVALDSVSTTLTVAYDTGAQSPTAILPGNVIEIEIESMLVTAVSSVTVTVIRGLDGTVKRAHAANTIISVSPILRNVDLFTALNHELRDLSSPQNGLFQVDAYEFKPAGTVGYDLPLPLRGQAPILDVLSVRYQQPIGFWPHVYGWRFNRAMDLTAFPSGYSLEFREGIEGAGRLHRVIYKAGFVPVESLADDLESTSGLPDTAVDIAVLGTVIRSANPREIGRDFYERQGDTRRAAEVPAGAQVSGLTALRREYTRRVAAERARLNRQYHRIAA